MLFDEGFTFRNFLVDAFAIFMFFVLIWLLIAIFSDLFRRHDVSGIIKVCWVMCSLRCPISAYSLTSSRNRAAWPNEVKRRSSRRETIYGRS